MKEEEREYRRKGQGVDSPRGDSRYRQPDPQQHRRQKPEDEAIGQQAGKHRDRLKAGVRLGKVNIIPG